MKMEVGGLSGDIFESLSEGVEAVVVPKNVVDHECGVAFDEICQPV